MTKRKFDRALNVMPLVVNGETVIYHTIKLWCMENDIDDDDTQRYTTYIKNNPDVSGARQFIGNWVLPHDTEIELPDGGTRRSTWGVGIHRVIVGLNDEQLDIVVNQWHCKIRDPKKQRDAKKQLKQMTTPTTPTPTTETIVVDGVERTVTTAPDAIPHVDTINASINNARKQLLDNINGSLNNDK